MDKLLSFLPYIIIWLAVLVFFRINKIWVFFFIFGAAGFAVFSVLALSNSIVEQTLSYTAIKTITGVNQLLRIPVMPFPGVGTVLMTGTRISGYTSLEIGTECSGLLEWSVFWGLVLFYPVLTWPKRILILASGSLFIFIINIFRVEMIIISIFIIGRNAIFFAHTVLGRGVFFFLMITLYWFTFTKTTLTYLNQRPID